MPTSGWASARLPVRAGCRQRRPGSAYPLLYLCSDAGYITGATLVVDAGFGAAGLTGTYPAATPATRHLLGRIGEFVRARGVSLIRPQ
jgi:hypothetical protein